MGCGSSSLAEAAKAEHEVLPVKSQAPRQNTIGGDPAGGVLPNEAPISPSAKVRGECKVVIDPPQKYRRSSLNLSPGSTAPDDESNRPRIRTVRSETDLTTPPAEAPQTPGTPLFARRGKLRKASYVLVVGQDDTAFPDANNVEAASKSPPRETSPKKAVPAAVAGNKIPPAAPSIEANGTGATNPLTLWLEANDLADYCSKFLEEGFASVEDVLQAQLTEEDLRNSLGMTKLGHRRRLLALIKAANKPAKKAREPKTASCGTPRSTQRKFVEENVITSQKLTGAQPGTPKAMPARNSLLKSAAAQRAAKFVQAQQEQAAQPQSPQQYLGQDEDLDAEQETEEEVAARIEKERKFAESVQIRKATGVMPGTPTALPKNSLLKSAAARNASMGVAPMAAPKVEAVNHAVRAKEQEFVEANRINPAKMTGLQPGTPKAEPRPQSLLKSAAAQRVAAAQQKQQQQQYASDSSSPATVTKQASRVAFVSPEHSPQENSENGVAKGKELKRRESRMWSDDEGCDDQDDEDDEDDDYSSDVEEVPETEEEVLARIAKERAFAMKVQLQRASGMDSGTPKALPKNSLLKSAAAVRSHG